MQRKTNLFYTKGNDSNFLTFSNFTEALTGNFLSTDWKVYPSRFLCLYIPNLEQTTEELTTRELVKEDFIKKYLVAYYENKLAFLRDYFAETLNDSSNITEYDIEGNISSFTWLLEAIYKYDPHTEINFVGEVTEFDYKGTYTDSICIIDASDGYMDDNQESLAKYKFELKENNDNLENIPYTGTNLYNWTAAELRRGPYAGLSCKFENDSDNYYTINQQYTITKEISENSNIKFNVIIPLFDITNMYSVSNFNFVDDTISLVDNINENIELDPNEVKSINNPMGIWFADDVIELKRDKESKYTPSWSLTICSQFKPFPYSSKYQNNDITSVDNQQAFQTYAQILGRQTELTKELHNISNRLITLEQTINSLNQLDNQILIEENKQLVNQFNDLKDNQDELINDLQTYIQEEVKRQLNNLKWK